MPGDILRAAPAAPLLLAPEHEGLQPQGPGGMNSAPTPFGPWNLWALRLSRSTGRVDRSRGVFPTAWVASVLEEHALGVGNPADLLDGEAHACLVVGRHHAEERVPGRRAASTAERSRAPSPSTGRIDTSAPCPCSQWRWPSTADDTLLKLPLCQHRHDDRL